jgi:hypothetical protein
MRKRRDGSQQQDEEIDFHGGFFSLTANNRLEGPGFLGSEKDIIRVNVA